MNPGRTSAIAEIGERIVRIGAARSIQYALRDDWRGLPDVPIYRVDTEGRIRRLGQLVPVRPDGFVMIQEDGVRRHSDGLPWWLFDMRPQGYLGRAFAGRHAAALDLPPRITDWTDSHALRALLTQGGDLTGNLLVGDVARDHFLEAADPVPVRETEYPRLAQEAARGEICGSSAGGEQPKFTVFAEGSTGGRHVLVKFSEDVEGPVAERWRDLLLAEHLALEVLSESGIPAARSRIVDTARQRFLELERFDRIGPRGRRALFSLSAVSAEFGGDVSRGWPGATHPLARQSVISDAAAATADLLHAFGQLICNTDMHAGNLSFVSEHGRPYDLSPAYDMTPMAFAPRTAGGLPDDAPNASFHPQIAADTWRRAEALARAYHARLQAEPISAGFSPCLAALGRHIDEAGARIARLA